MDPTAPSDNDQDQQGNENQQHNPVQPGGFVVSGEPGGANPNQAPSNLQVPQPTAQEPKPPAGNNDLQSDLQSTVAAATGTNLAGKPDADVPPEPVAPLPSTEQQPDPTPFTPPPPPPSGAAPTSGPSPVGTQPSGDQSGGESNSGKMKSLIIVVAVFILVAILAAVAWYFILNRGQTVENNVTGDTSPLELPSSPSPRTEGGFGNLPEGTPEATSPADIEGDSEEVSPQVPIE